MTISPAQQHPVAGWQRFVSNRCLLVFATVILLLLALPPANLWPLAFVALVPLYMAILTPQRSAGSAAILAWMVGALYWAAGNHTLILLMLAQWEDRLSPWLVKVGVGGIFALLALIFGLFWAVGAFFMRRLSCRGWLGIVLGSAVWIVLEMAATLINGDAGFGIILGYSLPGSTSFGHLAQAGGVWFVSFGLIGVNWLVAHQFVNQPNSWRVPRAAVVAVAIWLMLGTGLWLWNSDVVRRSETVRVAVIGQPQNIPSPVSDALAVDQNLFAYQASVSEDNRPTLIIVPPGAYAIDPASIQRSSRVTGQLVYPDLGTFLTATQQKLLPSTTLIAGVLETTNPSGWLNQAVAVSPDLGGYAGLTAQRRLQPFADMLPFAELWPAALRASYLNRPSSAGLGLNTRHGPVSALFASEIFAPGLARSDTAAGATIITSLLNESRGQGAQLWHERAAAYRAVETGRAVVLAGKHSRSRIILPTGKMRATASSEPTASVVGEIPLRQTPTLWIRLAPVWSVVLLLALLASFIRLPPLWRRRS